MPKPGYEDRVIQHTLLWVNGIRKHNEIDNECLPDFSCCIPNLYTEDDEKRRASYQRLLERLDRA